jgi:hypothetical protein
VFPNSLRKLYEFNEKEAEKCDKVIIDVTPSNEYKRQYNQSTNTNREIDDEFRKGLKTNSETWFDNGDNSSADTHYLKDYSRKDYVMFSKKINDADRFNYKVYQAEIRIDKETSEKTYYQKIVLDTCLDHTIGGKPGSYVKGQTGNTWHSSSKAAKRKRKLLKQNKKDDLN